MKRTVSSSPALLAPANTPSPAVLLIEDSLASLPLIDAAVARWPGRRTIAAMHGGLGAVLAQHHQPAVILLHLAGTADLFVLRQLQADPRTRDIPVITFSAETKPGLAEHLEQHGVLAHCTLPLDMRRFLELLGAVLGAPAPAHRTPAALAT